MQKIQTIGAELIKVFEKIEASQAAEQLRFLNDPKLKALSDLIPEVSAKLPEIEANG